MNMDLFTENNAKYYCPIRVIGLLGMGMFLFLEMWTVVIRNHDFDAISFGTAFAAMIGSYAGSITLKGRYLEGKPPGEN